MTAPKPEKTKSDLRFEKFSKAEPLNSDDKVALAKLIENTAFVKLMGEMLRRSDEMGVKMLVLPLYSEELVRKAIMIQGEARGYAASVEFVLTQMEWADIDEKPEGEKQNG